MIDYADAEGAPGGETVILDGQRFVQESMPFF
jgi:hypothetical protein